MAASAAPTFKATTINFKVDICQSGVPPFLRSCTFPVEKWLKNGNDTTHGIEVQKQEKSKWNLKCCGYAVLNTNNSMESSVYLLV